MFKKNPPAARSGKGLGLSVGPSRRWAANPNPALPAPPSFPHLRATPIASPLFSRDFRSPSDPLHEHSSGDVAGYRVSRAAPPRICPLACRYAHLPAATVPSDDSGGRGAPPDPRADSDRRRSASPFRRSRSGGARPCPCADSLRIFVWLAPFLLIAEV
jgi:hypothetical protein